MRRRRLLVLAGAVAGAAVPVAYTVLVQEPTYRADATVVLVREGQPPGSDPQLAAAAAAAAGLFESRAVAESVVANLRLEDSPEELLERVRVAADRETSLIRVTADAPARHEARRVAQAVTEVATVLYNDRFGPGTTATVWESARAEGDPVSRDPLRGIVLGALAGALLGGLADRLRARPRPPTPAVDLEQRFVVPAEPLPLRAARVPEPAPGSEPELRPQREPGPSPAPSPAPSPWPEPIAEQPPAAFSEPAHGSWTVADVERLVATHGDGAATEDELGWYLQSLRAVADEDGRLPPGVESVIEDVYGPLLERAREARPGWSA